MDYDIVGSQIFTTLLAPISATTNNNATVGFDTNGYEGEIAVIVSQGIPTAGDTAPAYTVYLQASATNAASNATNTTSALGSRVFTGTTNNTASKAVLTFDKRAEFRYLFVRTVIVGVNAAAPLAIMAVGRLQMQPN